jgi:HTH-type transcriptional regulator / antitoxin HigA
MDKPTQYQPDLVTPPGDTLRETLEALSMSQADFADRTGLSRKTINQILQGIAPITHETALAFEKVIGASAGFWLNLETSYQAFLARKEEEARFAHFKEWAARFPLREMERLGWIEVAPARDWPARCHLLLTFFAVAGPDQWTEVWSRPQVSFRRSEKSTANLPVVATWLRQGERMAGSRQIQPYDEHKFRLILPEIRKLTSKPMEIAQLEWHALCDAAGVHLQFVQELPKLGVSGATWWQGENPVIQLSLRFKTTDHLWFTFFHEAKHVLQKVKKRVFLDAPTIPDDHDPLETEANHWAGEFLIPTTTWKAFIAVGKFTSYTVTAFARSIGTHPGIVVGRLQHEKRIAFSFLNDLKGKVTWK